jgi:hypothetical protein
MNFESLAKLLTEIDHKTLFLRFNPEVLDFTDKESSCELQFFIPDGRTFKIDLKDESMPLVLSFLGISLFEKDCKIFTWNWKCFASYVFAKRNKFYDVKASIVDIKIIESFSGIKKNAPESYVEAFNRIKNLVSSGFWKESESVYKNIHLPLMTTVIPSLENIGIVDSSLHSKVHAYYEIDGQDNGRLKCFGAFKNFYVPHTMGSELKEVLKPVGYDNFFMSFDFKGMEVFVLAHLSKDRNLLRLCDQEDIYLSLYRVLIGQEKEKNDRELAKKCFLPVIYGQSARSLSLRCGLAADVAEKVVERISSLFPTAISFVADCESKVKKDGYAKDVFGKRRSNFEVGKEYLARNFAVQSPAATICLEKLISLYFCLQKLNESLKDKAEIAYTVHDGYVVYATKENWKQVYKKCMDALTSESELCPGLKLKVSCKGGRNLNDLKVIKNG